MIIPGRIKALVVDDNAYARGIAGASLKKLGVSDITESDGGAEAILQLQHAPFDVMLMDWYMPDISGAGIMSVLRDPRFGANVGLKVILMTAYASRDNVVRARQLGVNEVLVKPFSTEQLGVALARVMGAAAEADGDEVFL